LEGRLLVPDKLRDFRISTRMPMLWIAKFENQWQKRTPRLEKSDKITELMTFD
jgi:hypothetical protein